MDVSVAVLAYNEERNIGRLLDSLLKQKLDIVNIKEIIIVSSGSTDNTDQIVRDYSSKHKKVRLITEKERRGKYAAINKVLPAAKSNIIVQVSADVLPKNNTIEELCKPLLDPAVGIVGGHPIPLNKKTCFMGFLVHFQWDLHHEICLLKPKFGEIIAFRKVFKQLPGNCVCDEENIASLINDRGFKLCYAPHAIVYNKGPENFTDFIIQRRKIYSGHLSLIRQKGFVPPTVKAVLVLKALLKVLPKYRKQALWILPAVFAETYGRLIGAYDYYVKRDKHVVWQVAESAKIK